MSIFNTENLPSATGTGEKKHCILLVDDEPENLNAIADNLANDYQVLTANNGEEALDIISNPDTPKISLIISDQRMPKMTGVEFFEKAAIILPKTMRIIVTGYMDVDAIIDSVNKAHIYRFILKPFDRQDFMLTVQRAIESFEMQEKIDCHQEKLEAEVAQRTQELEKTQAELKEALLKTEEQAKELEHLNEDKDKFFAILAHDIRGPLGILLMMTDLLEEKVTALNINKGAEIIHRINNSTLKLQKLIENILQWSQVHSGHIECNPISLSPYEIVQDSIEIVQPLLTKHHIEYQVDITPEQMICADPDMTWAVFRNLLSNAIKFTPKDGTISVTLSSDEEQDTLTVTNSGSYIEPEAIDLMLRIDTKYSMPGQRGEKGTGLGLILCKEYMNKHGGDIHITSDETLGTSFHCTFPKGTCS